MYKYKAINFGFVLLCLDTKYLKKSIVSIKQHYSKTNITTVVPDNFNEAQDVVKGGDSFISMLNCGLHNAPCEEWNFVIVANDRINGRLDIKYSYFIENERDILYPIRGRNLYFVDNDISGTLIHKKTFLKVGDFQENNLFKFSKAIWEDKAISKKCQFKGVVGAVVH